MSMLFRVALMYLAKDFIETKEGLIFAVVENGLEQGKLLCFLRYILAGDRYLKVNTEQANQFLAKHYPHYLYDSLIKEAHCHALTVQQISKHYQPRSRLKNIVVNQPMDNVEEDLMLLYHAFKKNGLAVDNMGITGSILVGVQNSTSDIDLVFYSRKIFNQARQITQTLIAQEICSELDNKAWQMTYQRRNCELSYQEYLWHEKRKLNKALIKQRKFDLSLVLETTQNTDSITYRKLKAVVVKAKVLDDSLAFDYPAEFVIKHQQINSIVCYTASYAGQAKTGEWIEAAGQLEQSSTGEKRIVVGSNREASGEYIKVIDA